MASLEDGSAVTREYKFIRQGDLQPYFYPSDIAGDDFSLARALSAFRSFFRSPGGQLWAEYFSLPTFQPQVATGGPKYNLDYVRTAFQDAAGNRVRVLHELRSLQRTLVSLFRLVLFLTLLIVAVLVSRFF
jgi:hypothetical protein